MALFWICLAPKRANFGSIIAYKRQFLVVQRLSYSGIGSTAGQVKPRPERAVISRPTGSSVSNILFDAKKVVVPWQEGSEAHYHNIWLRDHCQCQECLHEDTKQRLLDICSVPKDIQPEKVEAHKDGMKITWSNDRHQSYFSWKWLKQHSYNPRTPKPSESPEMVLWGSSVRKNPPTVQYKDVMASDEGVAEWAYKIRKYGFCYVEESPISPGDTEKLLERIAFVRPTHYGGFYDFTADLASKDTAYTSLALRAHTDTTYFTDPAGLQMFHLLSHTEGSGGASLLVDGFLAAEMLREESPEFYQTLSKTRIRAHASGNVGISIQPAWAFPVLNHHPETGELWQVRWNSDDRATMDRWESNEELEMWYEAVRKWSEILKRPEVEYWEQLRPGRPLIFDNWRVLHGRSSFTGKRRICGGYVNRDDFMSRYRMTSNGRDVVLQEL